MHGTNREGDKDATAGLSELETKLLTPAEERELLRTLGECKMKLGKALASIPTAENVPDSTDDPRALTQFIADFYTRNGNGRSEARLGAVFRLYSETRGKLALANTRLVAHVAKRFRDHFQQTASSNRNDNGWSAPPADPSNSDGPILRRLDGHSLAAREKGTT